MTEKICPGGSTPDSNVIWCDDFETGSAPWLGDGSVITGGYNSNYSAWSGILTYDGSQGYDSYWAYIYLNSEYTELYKRLYIYFSDPYTWGTTNDLGIYFLNDTSAIPFIGLDYSVWGNGQPSVAMNERLYQNQGKDLTFQPGKWYLVEFYVKLNTPGSSNGITRLWVDDATQPVTSQTLRLEYTNLLIRSTGQTQGYNQIYLADYHQTCYSNCPDTIDQWMKWDNIVISKSKIGPITPTCPSIGINYQVT